MKKIISAVLALTVLLSMCACNGDVEGTETSDVSSVPVISVDPSSMLSSDAPSSDIPSNEGSKPDENASSEEPTPPPTPEEEEEQARIQKALNNPGASLDYDVFLVDAPEEGNEWKLLRYNMEEEKIYDEFSFSPKNATGSYTLEFADEYVGNILKVTFEDGTNCYIDVEKNKFYNSSEFKGLSKTLSVTKRNIGVTKNGQYEVWTTSHPDYGKVYYSELNEDENLLLTVFLKNNKYTFTSYDYETKEFKNLFTISEKPEVKLLNDGWFIFELEPPTETEDGRIYACNINEGVRRKIKLSGKRIPINGMGDYINALPNMLEGLMEKAKNGNVSNNGQLLWWLKPHATTATTMYCYLYDMSTGEIRRTAQTVVEVGEKDQFFRINGAVAIKFNSPNAEIEYKSDSEERLGRIKILEKSTHVADADDILNARVKEYYFTPDGKRCLCNVINEEDDTLSWKIITILTANEDREIIIRNKNALNNPGAVSGDEAWIIQHIERDDYKESGYRFYTYNLLSQTLYLKYTIKNEDLLYGAMPFDYGVDVSVIVASGSGKKYLRVFVDDEWAESDSFYFDCETGKIIYAIPKSELNEPEQYKVIRTEFEPVIGDGYIEIPATYNGFGEPQETVFLKSRKQVIISYGEYLYGGEKTYVVIYDYTTKKFKEILQEKECADLKLIDDRFVLINVYTSTESCELPNDCRLYIYDLNTGKIVSAEDVGFIWGFVNGDRWFYYNEPAYKNGLFWWYDDDVTINEDGTKSIHTSIFTYDPIKNQRRDLVTVTYANFNYDVYPLTNWTFTKNGVVAKYGLTDFVGPLYYCTVNKTACISEKALRYFVCEDQGYVMYYEEQADGSFEWKYYYF